MKKFDFIFYVSVIYFCANNIYAQSYPPVTPPPVKSRSSIFVDDDYSDNGKSDLLKKVNVLETNINNFVPMLMKNSSDINKMRDNADSLVVDLKKQLNDLKHSVKVYDLRLLDVIERLDKLESKKNAKLPVEYVKNPLDVELNKVDGKAKENKNASKVSGDNKSNLTTSSNVENKGNQQKINQTPNSSSVNLNALSIEEPVKYHDPLARNQIHIPNL